MLNDKIEFHGKMLSMRAISLEIGISRDTLLKHYEATGDIYEAEKICRGILEQKNGTLIDYNGEMLAIQTIAKKEGIKDAKTLKKYYEQTGDIYKAIKKCKNNKVEYNGEMLTMNAIATKTGLKGDTLRKYYEQTGDIYEAVRQCSELRKKQEEAKIEYNGEMLTITEIARRAGPSKTSLKKYYLQTGDIYKAIEMYERKQEEYEDSKIEYKGERKFLVTIAKDEGVAETTLVRYYKKYGKIDKAVYMAQIKRKRTQKIKLQNSSLGLSDLSIILGIKESELINMLNSGMSIEEIKQQKPNRTRRSTLKQQKLKLPNGQPLLDFCVENGLNFSCIYYAINTYGKSVEEAIEEYRKNGQNIPQQWIFEKYGILLKHLLLQNNINSQRVISYMRKGNISINDALEEYVIRRNCRDLDLDYEWMHELYGVLTDDNMAEEYDDFKSTFFVNEQEEDCIIASYDEIETLQRKLLLYEIAEAFREGIFEESEKGELLRIYDITDEEVECIFLDLYNGFGNKISLSEPQQKRRLIIADITKKWYYMTETERNSILEKENVSPIEKQNIEALSSNIIKYQREIHINQDKQKEGVDFDGE